MFFDEWQKQLKESGFDELWIGFIAKLISNPWHTSNGEKESKLVNQNEAKVNGYGLVSTMARLHKWEDNDNPLVLIDINICEDVWSKSY